MHEARHTDAACESAPRELVHEAAAEPVRPIEVGERIVGVEFRWLPWTAKPTFGTSGLPPPAVLPGSAELVSFDCEYVYERLNWSPLDIRFRRFIWSEW